MAGFRHINCRPPSIDAPKHQSVKRCQVGPRLSVSEVGFGFKHGEFLRHGNTHKLVNPQALALADSLNAVTNGVRQTQRIGAQFTHVWLPRRKSCKKNPGCETRKSNRAAARCKCCRLKLSNRSGPELTAAACDMCDSIGIHPDTDKNK